MILGVNIDHVATVRNARKAIEPDPVVAAALAMLGGADGITVHLREDRRHIKDRDVRLLRETVAIELNLEMAATREMIKIAADTRPDLVTIVPEKRQELTTEGGLDIKSQKAKLKKAVRAFHDEGITVSLFINPSTDDVCYSKDICADMVEIHTGLYANATGQRQEREFAKVSKAVNEALKLEMQANAGHGLNYSNAANIAKIHGVRALYIGHSIISRAVFVGIERAVREMKALISK